MPERVSCETCRWFDPYAGGVKEGWGLCRINPPIEDWPQVRTTDWCGSFAAVPDAEVPEEGDASDG
jgi:hypothetical protein